MVLALLIIEILLFLAIDKKIFGTYLTPTNIIGIPFLLIILLNKIFLKGAGFVELFTPMLWVWSIGLFCFWLGGIIITMPLLGKTVETNRPFVQLDVPPEQLSRIFLVISYILILLASLNIIKAYLSAGGKINSDVFEKEAGSGIGAHALLMLRYFMIYFIVYALSKRAGLMSWTVVIVTLFFTIIYKSKTWILIPLVASIFGRILLSGKYFNVKHLTLFFGLGILVFWVTYSLSFGHSASALFIKQHFTAYINAGILGFSEYLRLDREVGISFEFLFQPVVNIFYKIIGESPKGIISNLLVAIGNEYETNVKTLFGSIYIYGGWFGGLITSFIWGILTYSALVLTLRLKSISVFVLYLFILGACFFGWFDVYFNHIAFYEIPLLVIFLFVLETVIKNSRTITQPL